MALLTDEQVQAAFDWLHQNSDVIGATRATVIRTKYRVERVKARLTLASFESSDAKRRAWAESQEEYAAACEAHADAEGRWAALQDEKEKCGLIIEAWRSINANERGMRKIG